MEKNLQERVSPRNGRGLRRDIQGLRAVAVLAVVIFHADLGLPGGFVGVDIFFVVSGFVITASLLREQIRTGNIRLREFYWRRFRRLVPALAVTIIVTLVVSALILSPFGPQQTVAATGIAALFSLANIVIDLRTGGYFDSAADLNPLLHTWTLSVEEQFYLVFPLVLLFSIVVAKKFRHAVGIALVLITAVSLSLTFVVSLFLESEPTAFLGFYSPVVRAWEFGIGALVAWWLTTRPPTIGRFFARAIYLSGLLLIGISFSTVSQMFPFPGPVTLLPVLGTALVIAAGSYDPWKWDPLRTRLAILIGNWSYSIYLWHWPFISLSKFIWPEISPAPAAVASLVFALASFYLVEKPFRTKKRKSARETVLLILIILGAPVVLAIAVLLWANHWDSQRGSPTEKPLGYEMGCHGPGTVNSALELCHFGERGGGKPAYLVGDSHAAHFTSGVKGATRELGLSLSVITASGCPLLDGVVAITAGDKERTPECGAWQEKVFQHLEISPAGTVILGLSDVYWDEPYRVIGRDGVSTDVNAGKLALLEIGLEGTIERLSSSGHQVVVVQTVPVWRGKNFFSPDNISFWAAVDGHPVTMSIENSRAVNAEAREIVTAISSKLGATVVDFSEDICPKGICQSQRFGAIVYRDNNHLTNGFSESLQVKWVEILEPRQIVPSP